MGEWLPSTQMTPVQSQQLKTKQRPTIKKKIIKCSTIECHCELDKAKQFMSALTSFLLLLSAVSILA